MEADNDGFQFVDPYFIKFGDIVKFKEKEYYFRPNGSMCLLYKTFEDMMEKKNSISVDRGRIFLRKIPEFYPEKMIEPESSFVPITMSEEDLQKLRLSRQVDNRHQCLLDYLEKMKPNERKEEKK